MCKVRRRRRQKSGERGEKKGGMGGEGVVDARSRESGDDGSLSSLFLHQGEKRRPLPEPLFALSLHSLAPFVGSRTGSTQLRWPKGKQHGDEIEGGK